MCGGYGDTDSNRDGEVTLADFFRDITDGGGAGYSGARFGGGTGSSVLDDNNDMYVSEAEYMRGQKAYEANQREGIEDGRFGNAYRDSQNILSKFSNTFGALPRGSIRQEAALGPEYGSPIETKNMASFLQGGGFTGAAIRGVSGFLGGSADAAGDMAMAPVRAYRGEGAPPDPVVTPEQQAISYDSIFNTGSSQFDKLPEAQRNAIIRGTRSLNSRLGRPVSVPANVPVNNVEVSTATNTADASGTPYVVNAEDMGGGMVKVFYGDNSSEIMPAINYQLMMQNYV
jgi:hypothetical protein